MTSSLSSILGSNGSILSNLFKVQLRFTSARFTSRYFSFVGLTEVHCSTILLRKTFQYSLSHSYVPKLEYWYARPYIIGQNVLDSPSDIASSQIRREQLFKPQKKNEFSLGHTYGMCIVSLGMHLISPFHLLNEVENIAFILWILAPGTIKEETQMLRIA